MKISIFGLGYVGLANAIILSKHNTVIGYDIDEKKISMLNSGVLPIEDTIGMENLKDSNYNLNFKKVNECFVDDTSPDVIIISTPTNYNEELNSFDTLIIESIIDNNIYSNNSIIIIKSTIPIGFTDKLNQKYNTNRILYSPEFLREGYAIFDSLNPNRIIVGGCDIYGKQIAELFTRSAQVKNVPTLITSSKEAESIKLFSNTYLAMRVSFFNEVDSFCLANEVSSKKIINGICLDPRIGDEYNNPSFGYGGYCLPKDTKQASAHLTNLPSKLISSIEASNRERKKFIAEHLIKQDANHIGIYRLTMKKNSSNFRESAIWDIIRYLQEMGVNILIYEPLADIKAFSNLTFVNDINTFLKKSDIILTNRYEEGLEDFKFKVFTRDIFFRD